MQVQSIAHYHVNEVSLTSMPINQAAAMHETEENTHLEQKLKSNPPLEVEIKKEELVVKSVDTDTIVDSVTADLDEVKKSQEIDMVEMAKSYKALQSEVESLRQQVVKSKYHEFVDTRLENVVRITKSEGDIRDVLQYLQGKDSAKYEVAMKSLLALERVCKASYDTVSLTAPATPTSPSGDNANLDAALEHCLKGVNN